MGLASLDAIATAPALEELLLLDMPQLDVDAYRVLRGHPSLRALTAALRSAKRSAEIAALLGLPAVENFGADFTFADA